MARLPIPGSDKGNWGQILNDYLSQSHNPDGTLKPGAVGNEQLRDDAISISKLPMLGRINGIAPLDANGLLPEAHIPNRLSQDALKRLYVVSGFDGITSLQTAIDARAAQGGGTVYIQGTLTLTSDIVLPRSVQLRGSGYGAKLYSATDRYLKIKGSGGGWSPSITNLSLDGIGIILGETASDYANGVTIRDVEIQNVAVGLTVRYNSWLIRGDNLRIYTCGTGILHDFDPVTANSGANIVYTNSAIFNCSGPAFYQNGAAIDGWHVSFLGCNLEHCQVGIKLVDTGDGSLDLVGQHFELNTRAHIEANASTIRFSGWAMELQPANVALFLLSGTASVSIRDSRIGWSASSRLSRATDTASLLIDTDTVHTITLGARLGIRTAPGQPFDSASTVGIKLTSGKALDYSYSSDQAVGHSSTNTTILWIPAHDANVYEYEGRFSMSAAEAGNTLWLFFNPGSGGTNLTIPIPAAATWVQLTLRLGRIRSYVVADFSDGTVWRGLTNPTHTISQARTIDVRVAGTGTATATLRDQSVRLLW